MAFSPAGDTNFMSSAPRRDAARYLKRTAITRTHASHSFGARSTSASSSKQGAWSTDKRVRRQLASSCVPGGTDPTDADDSMEDLRSGRGDELRRPAAPVVAGARWQGVDTGTGEWRWARCGGKLSKCSLAWWRRRDSMDTWAASMSAGVASASAGTTAGNGGMPARSSNAAHSSRTSWFPALTADASAEHT